MLLLVLSSCSTRHIWVHSAGRRFSLFQGEWWRKKKILCGRYKNRFFYFLCFTSSLLGLCLNILRIGTRIVATLWRDTAPHSIWGRMDNVDKTTNFGSKYFMHLMWNNNNNIIGIITWGFFTNTCSRVVQLSVLQLRSPPHSVPCPHLSLGFIKPTSQAQAVAVWWFKCLVYSWLADSRLG